MSSQIHTYFELLQQIHDDLRVQHPEWIQPNGESTMCDSYEARLLELVDTLGRQDHSNLSPRNWKCSTCAGVGGER